MGSSSPNPPPGDDAGGTDPPARAGDPLAEAAAELYGADPQDFTERRKALAAAAKAGGDATAARQIAALRKPTRAAWVVNRLARADPGAPARLADLAAALRDAEQTRDGPRLRELSAARGRLIDTLTSQALAAADLADPATGLRDEVSATITAALADPEVAAGFAAGTLTRAAEWAGFGLALSGADGAGDAASAEPGQAPTPLEEGLALRAKRRGQEGLAGQAGKESPAGEVGRLPQQKQARKESAAGEVRRLPPQKQARKESAAGEVRRLPRQKQARKESLAGESDGMPAAEPERREDRAAEARLRRDRLAEERALRLAEEAAEAAARRQQVFEDAERAVASAAAAATDAVAKEDRLEVEVRALEEVLTRTRAALADARLQARRAEAAERKARRTLEHLQRPDDE